MDKFINELHQINEVLQTLKNSGLNATQVTERLAELKNQSDSLQRQLDTEKSIAENNAWMASSETSKANTAAREAETKLRTEETRLTQLQAEVQRELQRQKNSLAVENKRAQNANQLSQEEHYRRLNLETLKAKANERQVATEDQLARDRNEENRQKARGTQIELQNRQKVMDDERRKEDKKTAQKIEDMKVQAAREVEREKRKTEEQKEKANLEKVKAEGEARTEEFNATANTRREDKRLEAEQSRQLMNEKWRNISGLFTNAGNGIKDNPKTVGGLAAVGAGVTAAAITATVVVSAVGIVSAKTIIPMIGRYVEAKLNAPKVVSETSKRGFFGRRKKVTEHTLDDFIAKPALKNQLVQLANQIKMANSHKQDLKNVLFYGPPGTGKTMFARILAQQSGLDYALTSGSEFAKITDTNQAIKQLHKMIKWAENSKKGLVIFIDEAESFLADRTLPTTTKWSVDMLNAFLNAVPKPTNKKFMFVFATNHPFKLDKAVLSRIGDKIEIGLPAQKEREALLTHYLKKVGGQYSAQGAQLKINPAIASNIASYARTLDGVSPRHIEYLVGEMARNAGMTQDKDLSASTASSVIQNVQQGIQEEEHWNTQRDAWVNQVVSAARN